ncbi:MAG: tetratricopeptide repeat protein [Phycisphaerales bacterium]|nr:tetratricopeptide repeat protein [Phycisphaerales bacterium]
MIICDIASRNTALKKGRRVHPNVAEGRRIWPAVVVAAVGLVVYLNSFDGQFIFDDYRIIESTRIKDLSRLSEILSGSRPIAYLSFAVNHAVGAGDVRGYHAVNLMIHVLSGLVLFGIIRRTLLCDRFQDRYAGAATQLALVCSMIWVVHPLQTQSVTYIIQRCESMMGLFYLCTLYCVIRGTETSAYRRHWYVGAVVSCALGMGCKAVMVTAPVAVLLYDRTFLGGTFMNAFRRRWDLYLALCATWLVLVGTGVVGGVLNPVPGTRTVGLGVQSVTPVEYALTQPGVILHYLRLSIWPHPLCLDYLWPVARTAEAIVFPLIAILISLMAVLWAFFRRPAFGFLGACFFLVLSPTSSFVPIQDIAFEHRMYLPLAAVVVLVVVSSWHLLTQIMTRLSVSLSSERLVSVTLAGAAVGLLGYRTIQRNRDYHDVGGMWRNVLAVRPHNPRAHLGLGRHFVQQEGFDRAVHHFNEAIRLAPDFVEAHFNLGVAFFEQRRPAQAVAAYREALRIRPDMPAALNNLGGLLQQQGKLDEAVTCYQRAIESNPRYADAHANYGNALLRMGKVGDAIGHLEEAVRLNPRLSQPRRDLALTLAKQERFDEALAYWASVLQISPDDVRVHNSLGDVLLEQEAFAQAAMIFKDAVRLRPNRADLRNNWGVALSNQGKYEQAIAQFNEALRLKPNFAGARENLKFTLAKQGRVRPVEPAAVTACERGNQLAAQKLIDGAIQAYREALRIDPTYVEAHVNLGVMLSRKGQLDEAIGEYRTALRTEPNHARAHYNLGNALSAMGRLEEAMQAYRASLENDPAHVESHINLGNLLRQLNQTDEAVAQYRKALETDPRNVTALCNLGAALASIGNIAEGIKAIRRALEIEPDHATARQMLDSLLKKKQQTSGSG